MTLVRKTATLRTVLGALALAAGLTACANGPKPVAEYPKTRREIERERTGTVSGNKNGFILFGGKRGRETADDDGAGIGVNAFLWKASLDTISFMPLASADPFGGVILTEWYTPAQTPSERLKVSILIKDKQLRSDGLKVSVFRQEQQGGSWVDRPADEAAARALENAILTRARQLRTAQG